MNIILKNVPTGNGTLKIIFGESVDGKPPEVTATYNVPEQTAADISNDQTSARMYEAIGLMNNILQSQQYRSLVRDIDGTDAQRVLDINNRLNDAGGHVAHQRFTTACSVYRSIMAQLSIPEPVTAAASHEPETRKL
jgi:hypothetical protein